jgi:DNA-binding response OmpR family regulator
MSGERILVAEDDARLRQVIVEYLRAEGFTPLEAGDGHEAVRLWQQRRPDLLVLDWVLPGRSGLDVARQVRAAGPTPIILLTARSEEPDVVAGLESGADDYVTKPASMRQLVARIRAVLRRGRGAASPGTEVLTAGDLRIDVAAHEVTRAGRPVVLTATEFRLLVALARSRGRVFSRLQLMEAALGDYYEGYERTIDSHVSHLRHKLGAGGPIETVHGVGYRLGRAGEARGGAGGAGAPPGEGTEPDAGAG